jgi:hypothetical protein
MLYKANDLTFPTYLDPERARAFGQHGFDPLLIHRTRTPFGLLLRVTSDER